MATTDVISDVIGTVWKIEKAVGDAVEAGELIMILESMKMEIPVVAPVAGTVAEIVVKPEDQVQEGDLVAVIDSA